MLQHGPVADMQELQPAGQSPKYAPPPMPCPPEFFMRLPSRIWRLQSDGAMSNRTMLVVGTPAGEAGSCL